MDSDFDDDFDDQADCWNCGGEGFVSNCFQEFACLHPDEGCDDCTRRCDVCNRPKLTPEEAKSAGALRQILGDALKSKPEDGASLQTLPLKDRSDG